MYNDDAIYEEDNPRQIARCEECNEYIYDDSNEIFLDDEGNYFCCLDCACRYHGIKKSEDV